MHLSFLLHNFLRLSKLNLLVPKGTYTMFYQLNIVEKNSTLEDFFIAYMSNIT